MGKKRPLLGVIDVLLLLGLLAGAVIVAYPFVSNAWVTQQNQSLLKRYAHRETTAQEQSLKAEYDKIVAANQTFQQSGEQLGLSQFDAAVSDSRQLKVKRDDKKLAADTIAKLSIPKIGVDLPVFANTSDWLLQFGACRLNGSGFPVGGKGNRPIISAHRGVPNATLFTHLPQLKHGDKFYLTVGDHKLAYKVIAKKTILPTDVHALKAVPGKDLVTLMTCTPYMINSHRLLVTGIRVPYTKQDEAKQQFDEWFNRLLPWLWVAAALAFVWLFCHVARLLMVSRQDYQLKLTTEPNSPITVRNGHFGKKRVFIADAQGQIDEMLPGGKYHVAGPNLKLKAFVKHLRDEQFTLK
ncbi:class C sortase [Lacticaseibacillus manihotivorans]|uniref:Sortase n=2 Tax=Lacticaseibacillus manihotivorans TaxID=88233 RepID=A0A0R1QIG6_9LACO|nr:class C sortase [Lacticaseibacillus manihotivorans]KRL44412.1 sortase [Lacticaseibacillus manihotivorans DSM 13343 = JCM 12514]QFQ92161.1 class C sortase [Lacticaseibacillus manihotivorans]